MWWADTKVAECQALPDASGCQQINIVVGLTMLCGLGAAAAFATLGAGIRFWPGRGRMRAGRRLPALPFHTYSHIFSMCNYVELRR